MQGLSVAALAVAMFALPGTVGAAQTCNGQITYCVDSCDAGNEVDYCADRWPGCFVATPVCDVYGCGLFQETVRCTATGQP
jgi:hypothetical protein